MIVGSAVPSPSGRTSIAASQSLTSPTRSPLARWYAPSAPNPIPPSPGSSPGRVCTQSSWTRPIPASSVCAASASNHPERAGSDTIASSGVRESIADPPANQCSSVVKTICG
eukprot:Amastigsp_a1519_367.p5 type:complete len:112 gc:universal Amastigsp_a1519_367:625-290(-)